MRSLTTFAAALLLLTSIALAQSNSVIIRGQVVRLDTGAPITGATVVLLSDANGRAVQSSPPDATSRPSISGPSVLVLLPLNSGIVQTATSDANGRFEFRAVAAADYRVQAQRTGFFAPLSHGASLPMVSAGIIAGSPK